MHPELDDSFFAFALLVTIATIDERPLIESLLTLPADAVDRIATSPSCSVLITSGVPGSVSQRVTRYILAIHHRLESGRLHGKSLSENDFLHVVIVPSGS